MLAPYRSLLATPGSKAFTAAGFVARLPISMLNIGIVLLVEAATGSYAIAGAVAATFAVVQAGSLAATGSARGPARPGPRHLADARGTPGGVGGAGSARAARRTVVDVVRCRRDRGRCHSADRFPCARTLGLSRQRHPADAHGLLLRVRRRRADLHRRPGPRHHSRAPGSARRRASVPRWSSWAPARSCSRSSERTEPEPSGRRRGRIRLGDRGSGHPRARARLCRVRGDFRLHRRRHRRIRRRGRSPRGSRIGARRVRARQHGLRTRLRRGAVAVVAPAQVPGDG